MQVSDADVAELSSDSLSPVALQVKTFAFLLQSSVVLLQSEANKMRNVEIT